MKISINTLRQYIALPKEPAKIRDLMEDVGLEVKRVQKENSDTVFTIELLANRGDHHCYYGLAREIYGRTGNGLQSIAISSDIAVEQDTTIFSITADECFQYTLTELQRNESQESGLTIDQLKMIELQGSNAISTAVDVTNLVNVEMGQPLHVFDADKINGLIEIRLSNNNETADLLFTGKSIHLPVGTLVISDNSKILAVAGVMGCEGSEPDENTTRIYLESATFDPVKVRLAARELGISSASATRFERGADPSLAVEGAQRAIYLLTSIGWDVKGPIRKGGIWQQELGTILLSVSSLNHYFDSNFGSIEIIDRLQRYGFRFVAAPTIEDAASYQVSVPPHRIWDVSTVQDIYEEFAKSVGYQSFQAQIPVGLGVLTDSLLSKKENVEAILLGEGFFEVFTDGFYSEQHWERMPTEERSPNWGHVRLQNAIGKSYALLKNNCLSQAVELVKTNLNSKSTRTCAYEWTRVFLQEGDKVSEKKVLWAIAAGNANLNVWDERVKPIDFYFAKGIVKEIAKCLSITLTVRQLPNDSKWPAVCGLHPGRRAGLFHQDELVGLVGEVHPELLDAWKVQGVRPCFIELSEGVLEIKPNQTAYLPASNVQPVARDVCILIPKDVSAQRVSDSMMTQSTWIKDIFIVDVFNSEKTKHKNAVTFSIIYQIEKSGKASLTADEINDQTEMVIKNMFLELEQYALERG